MMVNKKSRIIIRVILIIGIVILISQMTYFIDKKRINEDKEPLFVITTLRLKDGGSKEFTGLGYKVFKWNIRTETSLETGYEIHRFFDGKDFEDGPSIDLDIKKIE